MKKLITTVLLLTFMTPALVGARTVDRDDLDDDIEEDVYVPVLFFDVNDIVPDFGAPRGGGSRTHEGQDFLAPKGTPIVSPTEAIVTGVGVWSGAGNYVSTANPGGETFRYMHLDDVADLEPGDKLDVGDYIGTVGDTGNAPNGVYHLHFEILDEDRDPLDPYPRLTRQFSDKKQVSFLRNVFRGISNDDEYAEFLVNTWPDLFITAYEEKWTLPREIREVLEDRDIDDEIDAQEDLADVLESIPHVLSLELGNGDDGVLVALLQIYLIYTTEGAERDRLAAAGPTGYYGTITAEVVRAYQDEENISETGQYDERTRREMLKRPIFALNLKR
jgi:hypothetical protein